MNQDVFVMDDVGQQGKSQWRSIINFVSPVKYPLECAQADKKNTKFFSSPLILCTTNNFTNLQGFTAKDCIAEPEALFRRAHVLKFTRAGGDIQYAKYDYQVNHSWMNMKIAPWNNCKFPDVFSGNEKNKLRGVYSAIQELLEKQKEMESTNEVPADDLDFITGKDVYEDENFEDAEIGEFQSETLTRMSSPAVSEAFRIIVSKLNGSTISLPNDSAKIKVEDMHVGILKRLLATRFQDENITINSFELYTEDGYQLHHARRLSYYFKNDEVVRIFYSDKDVKPTVAQRVYGMVKSGSSAVMEVIGGATEKAESIKNKIVDDPKITLGLAAITAAVSLVFYHLFSTTGNIQTDDDDAGNSEVISDWKKLGPEGHKLFSESGVVATEDETNNTRRYFRFFEIFYYHEGIMKTEYCQGAVSGKYALLPLHALGDDITVNIFRDWDRYQAKHYEYNLLPCRIYKSYPHLDVAIVEFQNLPTVPFKNANMIFKRGVIKEFSSELYFCNAFHRIRSIYGTNIRMNKDPFRVVNYRKEIAFGQDAGLTYEISALGLCGSLIIDRLNGFVGMHVAGNGKDGFAVVPTSDIRNEIANIMLSSADPNYEHREELNRVNFSGSRLQYDQAQLSMAMQNTGFKPTMLNAEVDDAVKESCLKYGVAAKAPANIHKYGNPSTTLKVCAAKSFAPMKPINKEEIAFARKCLRTFMCEFTDLTDEETAFGDKRNITSLNKDAANGYGYKPTKAAYFDYENKTISPEFSQALRDFEVRCKNGTTRWEDFVAKEALKAEIRPIGKDPRTFRVMPLHHIFLVKKYLGKLFSHVRDEMWSNGIAIGMNPYKDWGKLYDKIKDNYGVFALDFGKWDGSCHSMIQDMVSEVVLEFYKGEFRYVLEPLLHSMVRGFTLVNDELLCTTHSLPSGAWVTAFFNSLINRALTAITIFREMAKDGKEAKVSDFYKCVDFVLGDDKICGTPKDMAAYFNAITLRDVAESLGMTATDCHKKPITTEFHDISEISFLKRTFQVHPVLGMVGPLSLETLLTTIQWYDSNKDYDVVMGGKSTVVQIESYLHSKEMLLLFQRLLKDHSWYKEMNERRIIAIMEESDDLFAFVREALDKKY
uniref:SF3 helicase domain-containing protein n=1 Tax=Ginkgo biloba picorna-like virus TaxID=2739851 RepID=A0A6M9BKI7_9VIRU|nr:hypothetical protein 1 [Ginkgo biloba picorna-like virus]